MEGIIISFRRGRHTYKPRQFIIEPGKKEQSTEIIGKLVIWRSAKKEIKGKIIALHGRKGLVRARFERGLPGQAINTKVEIKE